MQKDFNTLDITPKASLKTDSVVSHRTKYWNDLYEKFLSNDARKMKSSRIRAICYQAWPLLFNRVAAFFEHYLMRWLIEEYDISLNKKRVLDIGCGTGRWCEFFAQYGADPIGVDLFPKLLSDNKKHFPSVKFSSMSATSLAFKKNSIDFVNAAIVLEIIPNSEKMIAIAEIVRVLRPGGIVFILEPIASNGYQEGASSLLRSDEWKMILKNQGLIIITQRFLHVYPLAAAYQTLIQWIGNGIKRMKHMIRKKEHQSSGEQRDSAHGTGVARRHILYRALNQFLLKLIACLSFPLEFLLLGLGRNGSHQIYLAEKMR